MFTIDTVQKIQDMARGAVFLGAGGGGDPYVGELFLRQQLTEGRHANIIDAAELADDAFVIVMAGMGAPNVLVEHLVSKVALMRLFEHAEKYYGRKIDALISGEIGGANSVFPVALGAQMGVPIVDGDGMGRAFPRIEMTTFSIFGVKATPAFVMDESGNFVSFDIINDHLAEDVMRSVCASLGSMVYGMFFQMTGAQAKQVAVLGTISQSLEIGRTIREARDHCDDPFEGLLKYLNQPGGGRYARVLYEGKIIDVSHEIRDGWHWGKVTIGNSTDDADRFVIEIQNEYIVARRNGRTVTVVPDLITVLDTETAEPLTAEMLIYGQRVRVIGYSAADKLRLPESLAVCGPRMFGLDEEFVPIEQLVD